MSGKYQIVKSRANHVGECQSCGAGQRGSVSVWSFRIGTYRAVLCLNCLKVLRIEIEHALLETGAGEGRPQKRPESDP